MKLSEYCDKVAQELHDLSMLVAEIAGRPEEDMSKGNATAYDAGLAAAFNGREMWANPYADSNGSRDAFVAWQAGWCFGKQNQPQLTDTKQ